MSTTTAATEHTARDLRHLLFAVEDQNMTVRDLRRLLFGEEQDAPLTATDVRRVTARAGDERPMIPGDEERGDRVYTLPA